MDKLSKIIIGSISAIIFLVSVVIALFIYNGQEPKEAQEKLETKVSEIILDECTDEYEIMEENVVTTDSENEKISPNCRIILTRYYKGCKDSINEYISVPETLVNSSKEELQNQYKDWEIKEFSSNKVCLYKEFDGSCGEHYILKDEDGKISIYKISEEGKENLYEKTNISIEYLPEKDKKAIKDGLKVNGKEKLNELIENFE